MLFILKHQNIATEIQVNKAGIYYGMANALSNKKLKPNIPKMNRKMDETKDITIFPNE